MMKISKQILLVATISLMATGCFRTRSEIAREKEEKEMQQSMQQNLVQYQQEIDRLQGEVGRLQGKIEELEHQKRRDISGLNTKGESTEKAVDTLKTQVAGLQQSQTALFEEIKKLKEENLQFLKQLSEKVQAPAPTQKKSAGGSSGSFESALAAFKAKDYDAAENGFRSFIEMNPKSKKVLDARFYLAESLYRKKDYSEAIIEFGVIHEKSPSSTLGRKSTLKIAESFTALGKNKDAKAFAQLLVDAHPNSDEAKKARKLLK